MRIVRYIAILLFITFNACRMPVTHHHEELPDFDTWWNYSDPAGTGQRFVELEAELTPSADADYRLSLKTQIARTLGLQRKFEEAHRVLDAVEPALHDGTQVAAIRYALERGRVWNSSGSPEKAVPLFEEAWKEALEAEEDFYAVDAAHMLGIAAPPDERMAWNLKALEKAESSDDPKAQNWKGSLYNNIGWTYHDQGDYENALDLFQKALTFREQQGNTTSIRIAKWSVARALRSLGETEKALTLQRELLEENEAAETPDGYVYEEIGENLLLMEKPGEARPYFRKAYELLSADPWMVANEKARLDRLATFGTAD